jgi:hypothetical protein
MKCRFLTAVVLTAVLAVGLTATAQPKKVLAESQDPVYEYGFDGDLGGAVPMQREGDNEDGGNAGTLPTQADGANVTYGEGVNGQAVFLDGTYGLQLPAESVGETYSIAFWVNASRFSNFGPIVQIGSDLLSAKTSAKWMNITKTDWDGDSAPIIWSRNEVTGAWPWYLKAYFTAGGGYMMEKEVWNHVVVTVDGSTTAIDPATGDAVPDTYPSKLYINGELIGEGPVATETFAGDSKVYLGINCWDIIFKGYFDDIKIYDRVLSDSDVAKLVDPSAVTPVYKYGFNDSLDGAVAVAREGDNEDGGNAGTIPTANEAANVIYAEGVDGKAIVLDGSYGLQLPAESVGETYSLAFWVNPARFSNFGPIIQVGSDLLSANTDWDGDSAPTIWSRNEVTGAWPWYLKAYFTAGGGYMLEKDKWSHIVVTVDGTQTAIDPATGDAVPDTYPSKLYVNGEFIGEGPIATETFAGDAKVYVGINCWDIIFKGLFDNIEIYNTVLTPEQVAGIAGVSAQPTPEPTPEPTATPAPTATLAPTATTAPTAEPTQAVETTADADESDSNVVLYVVIGLVVVAVAAGAVIVVKKKSVKK